MKQRTQKKRLAKRQILGLTRGVYVLRGFRREGKLLLDPTSFSSDKVIVAPGKPLWSDTTALTSIAARNAGVKIFAFDK